MDNRSIGVFDSGLGGLSVMRHLIERFPNENFVYFGDTARLPYGTRSKETVMKYVESDLAFLNTFDIKGAVVACGTASSVALPYISKRDYPLYGVVEVSAAAAVAATKNGRIGILGTESTINSGSYEKFISEKAPEMKTYPAACPLFVPLVENGFLDDEIAYLAAEKYVGPLRDTGIDTLILGCTHYPLLRSVIQKVIGEHVLLIDPGEQTGYFMKGIFENGQILPAEKRAGAHQYYVSDSVYNFTRLGSLFLGKDISEQVKKIDIEKY